MDEFFQELKERVNHWLTSIENNGRLGQLIRVSREAVCGLATDSYQHGYTRGYEEGRAAAELKRISDDANSMSRE